MPFFRWLIASAHWNGPRRVGAFFVFCLLLRYLSPFVVHVLVAIGVAGEHYEIASSANEGEFVAYAMNEAEQREIMAGIARLQTRDFKRFRLRFENGPPPIDTALSTPGFVSFTVRKDSSLNKNVFGKASPTDAGDPEIRLNSKRIWDAWTIMHEAEHWRLADPHIKGAAWCWLPALVDFVPMHDLKLWFRHLFPGGDWLALLVVLASFRHWISQPS